VEAISNLLLLETTYVYGAEKMRTLSTNPPRQCNARSQARGQIVFDGEQKEIPGALFNEIQRSSPTFS